MDYHDHFCTLGPKLPLAVVIKNMPEPEFLITFEWAKWAQQWLVCVPLGIYFEPNNKELMLLVTI